MIWELAISCLCHFLSDLGSFRAEPMETLFLWCAHTEPHPQAQNNSIHSVRTLVFLTTPRFETGLYWELEVVREGALQEPGVWSLQGSEKT